MNFFFLLAGILIAATLFVSVLWSFAQALRNTDLMRRTYAALAALTIAGMAAVSYDLTLMMKLNGAVLIYFGVVAVHMESGSSKLLPLVQLLFGLILLAGLPSGLAAG